MTKIRPEQLLVSNQTAGLYAVGNTAGEASSTTFDIKTMSFSGAGIASVGYSGNNIVISVPAAGALVNISAGTTSGNVAALTFSNSNGVSFGLNNGIVTATVVPGGGGGIANAAGTQTATSGTVVFANSNGITFGMSNSNQITASYTVPTLTSLNYSNSNNVSFGINGSTLTATASFNQTAQTQSNIQGISAGTQLGQTGNVVFSNSNGISFGMSNSSVITASYTVPTQTNQTEGKYAIGNTVGQSSSSTFDARTMSISGTGNVSVGYSGNALVISGSQSVQTNNVVVPSAGTQTATSGTVSFVNSNGISFGMSNSNQITASYTVPSTAGLISAINVSGGTTSNNLTALTFSNSNGVSFGLNGSTVTASIATQTNQTEGFYAVGNTVGQSSSSTFDARTLSFSGAGIASVGYSAGNVIISVPSAGASVNFSAGTTSGNLNAVTFSNSNGVSFGLSNGVITATITPGAAAGVAAIQGGTQTATSGTVIFSNSNGITFGMSNSSVMTASYTVPSTAGLISNINVSAGTTSNNLSALTFSNSNGLSFGLNGSTITGSYTVPTQTNQSIGLFALGNTTQNSSTTLDARSLSFNGLGAASIGYSNGSIQISVQTALTNINISAGTTSNNFSALTFSNSNGISFGLNGSTITASYTVPTQSNQTEGRYALGNTTGQSSSSTFDARTMSFSGAGNISLGYSANALVISGSQSNQTNNVVVPSAGTQTATSGTVVFSNSNGISFGMSGSSQITASYTVPSTVGLISNINFSAGTTSNNLNAITFSNLNGISFGLNASTVTASYTVPSTAGLISAINVSAGTTSNNLSAFTFSNSNGLSFGLNGSTITGSYTVPTQTNQTEGLYALGNTTGQSSSSTFDARTLSISGAGNISVGYSGNALVISATGGGGGIANQAGTQTATSGTVVFSNSNGISFGMSNSSVITASYTVPTQTNQTIGLFALGNTTQNSSTTLDARSLSFNGLGIVTAGYSNGSIQISAVQTNQTEGFYALGNTVGQSSSSTFDARTLSISGAGIASVGYSGNALVISVPSAGALVNISAGTTSNNLGAITFSNSNNVSFGLNGSTLTASVPTQSNQTVGLYAVGNTTGQSSSSTFDARTMSFSGAGIASVGYSGNNIVISVPSAGALINVSAGTTSNNLGAITFSNSNGLAFGLNGSTLTGSYTVPTQTNQTVGLFALGNTTQNSSTTLDARSLSFNGLGAATVGYSNGSIQVSVPVQTVQTQSLIQAIYDGANSITTGTIRFTNANGVSFSINGQTISGSVAAQTNQTVGLFALGNTTQNSSTTLDARSLSFNGLGAASIGYSNGSIQISVPNALTNVNISAGTTSNNLTAFVFSNSNNVSFGLNGSTVTATVTTPAQTNQTVGLFALGNTTQNSSTTLDARSLSFNGLGIVTAGYSNGSIQISATQSAQTQNIVVPSAGTQTATSGTVVFSNSNGISFGMSNSSVITASYTVPSTAGLISAINVSAGTTSNNLSALTFSNSNGLSFGLNGSTITGSYTVPTQTNQSIGLFALGNTTQNSSTTLDARSLSFNGLGAATVGYSNGSIQISVPVQTVQTQSLIQAIFDGANSITTGTIRFTNANGVSFSINGQTISGSVAAQTNQTVGLFALGNTTQNSSTTLDARSLSFNGLGAATVGYSNGSIQISVPNALTNVNISAGTTSNNLTAFVFSNSNNVSFGLNGSTVTATITVPAQTNQTEGRYALGNTTGQSSSSTFDARTLSISGAGNISLGYSANALVISGSQSAQTQNVVVPSAGTQSATSGTVIFSNSNGISFGMSNSSVITASYTVPSTAGLISAINVSAGTTSNNLSAITFSNSNGMSFGLNGSTITGSYTVPTQTNQTVGLFALGNTTQNSSTTLDARSLSFNGLGAATVGYSNGSIQISVPTALTNVNISAGTTSNNLTAFVFSNSNNVSFGLNGSTVTATITVPAQTNQTIGLFALGNTTQNSSTTLDARSLSFNGLGAATVGYSNGSIQVSVPVQTAQTQSNIAGIFDGANSISTGTIRFTNANGVSFSINGQTISGSVAAQTNQTEGRYAIGNTTGQSSSSTFDARTMSISGAGNISVGYSGNALVISGVSGANVNVSAGTTSNNLTNFVFSNSNSVSFGLSGSTITASIPNQTFVFSNSNNVSFGINGSTITASAARSQVSQLLWPDDPWQTNFPISNASFSIQKFNAGADIVANQANLLMVLSGNTNSSGALTVSLGIYTMSGSTMSLASSDSRQITWTSGSQTSASSIYGGVSGTRYRTISLNNWSITAGDYMLGVWFRTTNNGTWNAFGVQGPTIVGAVDANETNKYFNGFSTSSFSTAMVASVNVTDTNYVRTGANAFQQPGLILLGSF